MMVIMYRVRICIGAASSALEILATYEASVDVDVGERNRANFLKVEVESMSVYLLRLSKHPRVVV